jgi:hypothetical protein
MGAYWGCGQPTRPTTDRGCAANEELGMRRITTRLLLVGVTVAGLIGLGFGVATLTAAAASASSGVAAAHGLAATTPITPQANAGSAHGTNPKNCPNLASSGSSGSASNPT